MMFNINEFQKKQININYGLRVGIYIHKIDKS